MNTCKYGVIYTNNGNWMYACCEFDSKSDNDGYFGTNDINEAYQFVEHWKICAGDYEVFEKANTQ